MHSYEQLLDRVFFATHNGINISEGSFIMSKSELQVNIHPMTVWDIDNLLSLDKTLRESDISPTYNGFSPIHQAFSMNTEEVGSLKRTSLSLIISLIEMGFVAESEGNIVGFIVGRQTYLAEYDTQVGEIAMIGVNPDYRGKGIGTRLINALNEVFRSKSVTRVRTGINPVDKDLLTFFDKEGFAGEPIIYYSKAL